MCLVKCKEMLASLPTLASSTSTDHAKLIEDTIKQDLAGKGVWSLEQAPNARDSVSLGNQTSRREFTAHVIGVDAILQFRAQKKCFRTVSRGSCFGVAWQMPLCLASMLFDSCRIYCSRRRYTSKYNLETVGESKTAAMAVGCWLRLEAIPRT